MQEIKLYELLGYVKISPYRTNTLKSIGNDIKMPFYSRGLTQVGDTYLRENDDTRTFKTREVLENIK